MFQKGLSNTICRIWKYMNLLFFKLESFTVTIRNYKQNNVDICLAPDWGPWHHGNTKRTSNSKFLKQDEESEYKCKLT